MRGDGAGSGYKKRCTRFKLVALCSPSLQLPGAIATAVGVLTLNQGHWHAKCLGNAGVLTRIYGKARDRRLSFWTHKTCQKFA